MRRRRVEPHEMTREKLRQIAHIIGPHSAAADVLNKMDEIQAAGDYAACFRYGSHFVVFRVPKRGAQETAE